VFRVGYQLAVLTGAPAAAPADLRFETRRYSRSMPWPPVEENGRLTASPMTTPGDQRGEGSGEQGNVCCGSGRRRGSGHVSLGLHPYISLTYRAKGATLPP
jgi:hypothetical protein